MVLLASRLREGVDISEGLVTRLWRERARDGGEFLTASGQRLQVIYPGRPNPYGGPDLVDALLATPAGELLQGDVEVHVRSSQWRAHGHHRDPAYDGLVLHVVMWDDEGTPTPLASGRVAPVLALEGWLPGGLGEVQPYPQGGLPPDPCLGPQNGERVWLALEEAGEERFRLKGGLFLQGLSQGEPSQVLYEGLMEALGYSQNRRPFLTLARALPYVTLERLARGEPEGKRLGLLRALLLGQAGFAPSPLGSPALRPGDWCTFRVRPANLPQRRLVAAAYLLNRYLEPGLHVGLLGLVEGARGYRPLEEGLAVREGVPTLLGRGRAGEIAVNVLLPFAWAWGQAGARRPLAEQALGLYRGYPGLGGNELTRLMGGRLLGPGAKGVGLACQEQGMIHLYRNYCRGRRCRVCPIGG